MKMEKYQIDMKVASDSHTLETLSFCTHGTPAKFYCVLCDPEGESLDKENVSPMVAQMQKLEERIKELEKNVDLLTRTRDLTATDVQGKFTLLAHNERLEKLESLLDVHKMQQIILDGARLHAEVIRLSQKLSDSGLAQNRQCKFCSECGKRYE